ncbi:hypothetical protein [Bradyrhizobium sp. RDM4]|uniref:hypothetical protein n=1 Tax=Bradyrhizobium sp. RDM4 TaxID=3378765 RepID=UPI0038FC9AFE
MSEARLAQSSQLPLIDLVRNIANGAAKDDGGHDWPKARHYDDSAPTRVFAGPSVAIADAAENQPDQAANCISFEPFHGEIPSSYGH